MTEVFNTQCTCKVTKPVWTETKYGLRLACAQCKSLRSPEGPPFPSYRANPYINNAIVTIESIVIVHLLLRMLFSNSEYLWWHSGIGAFLGLFTYIFVVYIHERWVDDWIVQQVRQGQARRWQAKVKR